MIIFPQTHNFGTAPPGPSFIFDDYSGGRASWSVRNSRAAYTGPAMRLRRSSGGESDFNFLANGDLDTASMLSWAGGASAFARRWYGSGPAGINAVQDDPARQPKIIDNGTLITEGGRPALEFDGVDDFLDCGNPGNPAIPGTGDFALFLTMRASDITSGRGLFAQYIQATGNGRLFVTIDEELGYRAFLGNAGSYPSVNLVPTMSAGHYITSLLRASETFTFDANGGNLQTHSDSDGGRTILQTGNLIGARGGSQSSYNGSLSMFHKGPISEALVWGNNQVANRSAITANINTYFGVF